MKTSKFTDEQIALALRQAEAGTPVGEICRKLGISEQTFYRWKKHRQDDPPRGAQKKMVRPAARRALVPWTREAYQLSKRRACRSVGVYRALVRSRSRRPSQAPLRGRLRELAAVRLRAGDQQLYVLLRRQGWHVNHKRIYRLYTEEGLALRRRRPRRHRSSVVRVRPRIFTVLDVYLGITVRTLAALSGSRR
jgi:putative transposase